MILGKIRANPRGTGGDQGGSTWMGGEATSLLSPHVHARPDEQQRTPSALSRGRGAGRAPTRGRGTPQGGPRGRNEPSTQIFWPAKFFWGEARDSNPNQKFHKLRAFH